jgi:hypothetical protein
MEKPIGPRGHIPNQLCSEWLKVSIPGTPVQATFPIPPEIKDYFDDCLYPPSILFYAKAVLETTARLFNKSGAPEYSKAFPDKIKFPSLRQRIREWIKIMEVVEVDRPGKRSRVLKRAGESRYNLGLSWDTHPEWPDWSEACPQKEPRNPAEEAKWRAWAKNRGKTALTLVK